MVLRISAGKLKKNRSSGSVGTDTAWTVRGESFDIAAADRVVEEISANFSEAALQTNRRD